MKILVGMPSKDSWGGPAACEPPFVEALKAAGHEVCEDEYVYGDKERPTPVFKRISRVFKTALRLRRTMSTMRFDVVHLNTSFDLKTILRDAFCVFLMPNGGTKIFLKMHGSDARGQMNAGFIIRRLIRYLRKKADGIGVLSSEERREFIDVGFAPHKIFQIRNVVSFGDELTSAFQRSAKSPADHFELLFVSRFITTKGLIETIRACEIVRDSGFEFTLNCVGDGEVRFEAEAAVTKLGLANHVLFTGYLPESDVTKYYFESDIFVFPTRHIEGIPIALFKAAIAGLPIVTTQIRAAADLLSEPENCLFCTQDAGNIAAKLIELINNKTMRESMSRNNYKFGEMFAANRIAAEYVEIYETLTA